MAEHFAPDGASECFYCQTINIPLLRSFGALVSNTPSHESTPSSFFTYGVRSGVS